MRVYVLGADRLYHPIDMDHTYYLAMPHHMMVGLYEAKAFSNTDRYGDFTHIYLEQDLSFSEVMSKFFKEAAENRQHKQNETPQKWYKRILPAAAYSENAPLWEYYMEDAQGKLVPVSSDEVQQDKKTGRAYIVQEIGSGKKIRVPLTRIPVFRTHIGRIINAKNVMPNEVDEETLDGLYSGWLQWEEVFPSGWEKPVVPERPDVGPDLTNPLTE